MECPHLAESAAFITTLTTFPDNQSLWHCAVCDSDKSPHMCLSCGIVQCGRYVNGHAKEHFESDGSHSLCIDCESLAAFCYICDEFVTNDTSEKHLERLRASLQSTPSSPSPSPATSAPNSPSLPPPPPQTNTLKTESEPEEVSKCEPTTRKKRRKRSHSGDSSSIENYRVLRKRRKPETKAKIKNNLRVVGLRNLGNTCFMNAVLQSLSNIQQFCKYFTQLPALDVNLNKNGKKNGITKKVLTGEDILLAEELRKTLLSLHQVSKTAISPESLFSVIWKVVPRFRGYQQQDAHEFLRYMLDRLHSELLSILPYPSSSSSLFIGPKGKSTIVTNIFGGVLQNEVNCLVCKTESKKHDPFLDLSLDIPQPHIKLNGSKSKEKESPGPSCQLQDCLNSFTELEELAETELYYCSFCKKKQRSTKRFWIRRLPNVLCLHIKRFRWSNYFRMKIDNYVEFPLKGLDMSKFILSNMHETRGNGCKCTLYDLAAVIVHHGSGAGSGHYTAYATHEGSWYHFNDSTVTLTDEETVAKSKAYIFFYIRREFKLPPVVA